MGVLNSTPDVVRVPDVSSVFLDTRPYSSAFQAAPERYPMLGSDSTSDLHVPRSRSAGRENRSLTARRVSPYN